MEKPPVHDEPEVQGLSEAEIARVVKEHGREIYRFILKKVRNAADAEDLYQTTLCEALRVRHTFMWQAKPQTWICGIAFNLVRNHFARSESFRTSFDSEEILEEIFVEGQDPEEIIFRNQVTNVIAEHIKALPEDMRQALSLVAEHNHSYEQAAKVIGVPVGTVRSRIFRAREYLKKWGSHDLLTG